MRSTLALGVLAAGALAAGAVSAADWPADPSPPIGSSVETVRAWITRNIDESGYVESAVNDKGVFFYDPASLRLLADGHVTGRFRSELFSPMQKNGHALRSARKTFDIDCSDLSYREVTSEEFAGSNLQLPIAGATPQVERLHPVANSTGALNMRTACDRARANKP